MNKSKITRRKFLTGAVTTTLAGFGLSGCGSQETPTPAPTSPPATATPVPVTSSSTPTTTPFVVPATPSLQSSVDQVSVRLLWTGDAHGQLRPVYHRETYGEAFVKAYGLEPGSAEAYLTSNVDYLNLAREYGKVGGYAHLASLIKRERAALPERTLLLEAGDAWYGSAIALLTEGQACVAVMNALGYDAMTLHWEFNLGQDTLLARIEEAEFPILVQNLVDTDFEDRVLEASLIKDFGDFRLAVVGQAYPFSRLTTEDPEANPDWRMGYRDNELQDEINRLRQEEGVDVVVLLSHMGYAQDRVMAERLSGIDVIVGGHTHDILWQPEQVGQTLLLQGGSHGKLLGKLDLEVRNGQIVGFEHHLIPVLAERIEPDPDIEALIGRLYEPYQAELQRVVGQSESVLYRRSTFGGTTDTFMTRAYREIMGADLGCAPGWRFGATLIPGPITVEDVYNVMKPTPTPLYKVTLTGKLLRSLLEDNLDNVFNPDPLLRLGGDTLRCAGLKADLDKAARREERVINPTVNGASMAEDRNYTVATSGGRTQLRDPGSEATAQPAVVELANFIEAQNRPISVEQPDPAFIEVN